MTTGRVIQHKGKYAYIISAPRDPVTGKYKQIWRTGFQTKGEAREQLRNHLNELDRENRPSDITVGEWLERWLAEERANYTALTIKSHTSCIRHHIIPHMGRIRLDKLSHTDIQNMYVDLLRGLSPVTVNKVHRTLRAAINKAVKRGILQASPMKRVDAPHGKSARRNTLNVRDAGRMLTWLRQEGFVAYYGAYLAVYGGLRLAEVCGLQWRDVEWGAGVIHVRRSRQRLGGENIIGKPKTADSVREIALPAFAMTELRRWQNEAKERLEDAGRELRPDDFVIIKPNLEPPETHAFAKGVKAALTALGLPLVTFHDLRHTHATWLLESGVDLKTVSQRLGHSSITVTADVYSHVTRKLQREAVGKLEEMMRSEGAKNEDL